MRTLICLAAFALVCCIAADRMAVWGFEKDHAPVKHPVAPQMGDQNAFVAAQLAGLGSKEVVLFRRDTSKLTPRQVAAHKLEYGLTDAEIHSPVDIFGEGK